MRKGHGQIIRRMGALTLAAMLAAAAVPTAVYGEQTTSVNEAIAERSDGADDMESTQDVSENVTAEEIDGEQIEPQYAADIWAEDEYNGIKWSIDTNGHLRIEGAGDYDNVNSISPTTPPWCNQEAYRKKITQATVKPLSGITSTRRMFYGCTYLRKVDLSGLNTSEVESMSEMFSGCSSLTELNFEDISVAGQFFDTKEVTDMSQMFYGCSSLSELNLSIFDTFNVKYMNEMFYGCSSLKTLDVSNFDMGSVEVLDKMFSGCSSLTTLHLGKGDMRKVYRDGSALSGCNSLSTLTLPPYCRTTFLLPAAETGYEWQDESGTVCTSTESGLSTKMTYKKVKKNTGGGTQTPSGGNGKPSTPSGGNEKPSTPSGDGTQPSAAVPKDIGSKVEIAGAAYTVTSIDPANPTVSFDGVSDENSAAVAIPKTVTYDGVEYKVTTVSPTVFSTVKDGAVFTVTDNRVESLTVEYKAPTNAKKTKITVPESVTYKGIEYKVTSVAAKAFKGNKKVKQIKISASVTKIGGSAFEGCTGLTSVTIGKGVTAIGKSAFKNCKKLTKITVKSTKLKSVGKNALKGVNAKCKIKVPKKQLEKYQKLFQKKGQKSSVKVVK